MFIQPAEYLDLTDRLAITTKKLEQVSLERQILTQKVIGMGEKIAILQSRIKQMETQKQNIKQRLKQHIRSKADDIVQHVTSINEKEKIFIEQKVTKLRNQSAFNKLKLLEERIAQNRLTSSEKQFCQKIKTLYIINKKKANCNINQLYQWVSEIINASSQNNHTQTDILAGINDSTQKSIGKKSKKQKKNMRNQSCVNQALQTIDQNQQKILQQKGSNRQQGVEENQSKMGKSKNQGSKKKVNPNFIDFLLKM